MDTLSSFINKRVKSIDELTVTELIKKCDMSKAKFYRCLAEPFRFTDGNLDTIAQELRLGENDKRILYEYRFGNDPVQTSIDTADEDKKNVNKIIADILLGRVKSDVSLDSRIYKLFHYGENDAGIRLCSSRELVEVLLSNLSTGETLNTKLPFVVHIFNCCSEHSARNLSALIDALGQKVPLLTNYSFDFFHFINDYELDTEARFEALRGLYQIASVSTYCCDHITFADLHATFLGNTDSCLIRFQDSTMKDRHILINFLRDDEVSVYYFTDCNLYSYLSHQYDSLKSKLASSIPSKLNSIEVSDYIVKQCQSARGTLLTFGPCFDNYLPNLWEGVKQRYLEDPCVIQDIRKQIDPAKSLDDLPHHYLIDKLTDGFRDRFIVSEEQNRPTILSAVGLRQFSETRTTSELAPVGIAFTNEEVLEQLCYLYDNLGKNHAQGQSYYLINSGITPPDTAFVVFDNQDIAVYFHKNQYSSIYWVILQHPEIASEFYRYMTVELTDEKTRNQPGSILFSDERAKNYVQMLIDQVQKRIDTENKL